MEPEVSVIISAYNHEKYIAQAIESVLNQTYSNIKLYVADDCSTDRTAEIIKKYESKIEKIICFNENSGFSRIADMMQWTKTSLYVAILNSDDYWEKEKIEKQVEYMENNPDCAACFTLVKIENESEIDINNLFVTTNKSREEWVKLFFENGNCLAHPSVLARRDIYEEILVDKNVDMFRQLPDFYMWLIMLQKYNIYVLQERLITFRFHRDRKNVSAIVGNNILRTGIEMGLIWFNIIKEMDNDFFKRTFKDKMKYKDIDDEEILKCEKFFVLASAKDLCVAQGAIYYYQDVMKNVKTYNILKEKYHINNSQFHKSEVAFGIGPWIKKIIGDGYDISKDIGIDEEMLKVLNSYLNYCKKLILNLKENSMAMWKNEFYELSLEISNAIGKTVKNIDIAYWAIMQRRIFKNENMLEVLYQMHDLTEDIILGISKKGEQIE